MWLGLTVGCARCHTHKYDPITQREYYQFFALLNNCDEPTIEVPSRLQIARGELATASRDSRPRSSSWKRSWRSSGPSSEAEQQEWEETVTPEQRARLPGPVQVAYDMKFDERDAKNKKLIEDYFRESEVARQAFPLLAARSTSCARTSRRFRRR